ncbi:MAG: amidohydrolase family protein [Candidatus Heimdallarchaeota archaeon]|nr:amidohydrolase family protein [Candidatus Heimdallarchaeota archaeon]
MLEQVLEQFPLRAIILGRTSKLEILHEIFNEADGLGIADVFSIDQNLVEEVRSLKAKSPDKIVAMHVSESEDVISKTYSTYGKRDIEMACDYSIFDFLIHATYANENDFFLLKKNNINIVCCPISNLYHSLKFPPISTILKKKILLGLGTDNVLCCNPDPFRLMAFTLYNARSDNQHITPKDILKALTVNPGLMIKMKIGQIAIGYSGDLIGINLENQNLKFSKDVYSAITMRANPSDIGFQMYKGKVIKWEGQK